MLQYMYINGGEGNPKVPVDDIKKALNLSPGNMVWLQ